MGKKGPRGPRSASRPAAQVFADQMDRAYQTALSLISKTKKLSRHRALKVDGGKDLAVTYNRFLARVAQEMEACTVKPGQVAEPEEAPSLSEFIGS